MKSRVEFPVCAEPARRIGCFEHKNTLAASRQVGRTDQAVMSCPDDDGVDAIQTHAPSLLFGDQNSTLVTACRRDFRAYTLWQSN